MALECDSSQMDSEIHRRLSRSVYLEGQAIPSSVNFTGTYDQSSLRSCYFGKTALLAPLRT
jgi:hypothetical protein